MSLSRIRISGFAAGKEKWPQVRLLKHLTKIHSTLLESLDGLKMTRREFVIHGENLNQWVGGTGRGKWGSGQERLSQSELPHPGANCPPCKWQGGGLQECPVPGMAEAEVAGPPRWVSASNEQESERPLLIKTLTLQTVLKVEILLEGFLTSRSQVIIGTGMDEVRSSYRRGEAPRSQEFPFVWSGVWSSGTNK